MEPSELLAYAKRIEVAMLALPKAKQRAVKEATHPAAWTLVCLITSGLVAFVTGAGGDMLDDLAKGCGVTR